MHVPSFLPLVGLTLISITNARSLTRLHSHARRDLTVSNTLPSKWTYSGCYTDSVSARGLISDGFASDDMTEGKCIGYCDQKGYSFAGVEYSHECYCGYAIQSTSTPADESSCNMACGGASSEPCGGPNRLNIFTNGDAPPAESPGALGYTTLGCYTDSPTARGLSDFEPSSDNIMTVYSCINTCMQKGYPYAGVEYGQECFCGSSIQSPSVSTSSSACNMPCTGDRTETCGGRGAMNLYQSQSSN